MASMYQIVQFTMPEAVGVSSYGIHSSVRPASSILEWILEPRINEDSWDAKYRKGRHEETIKWFEEFGSAMMIIETCGIVCGDFSVRPFLITEFDLELLEGAYARLADCESEDYIYG